MQIKCFVSFSAFSLELRRNRIRFSGLFIEALNYFEQRIFFFSLLKKFNVLKFFIKTACRQ